MKAQHIGVSRQDVDAVRKYTEWRTFLKPSLSYKTAIINLVASAPVYWTSRTYGIQHKDNITFEPNLFFRAMPVSDFGITATYNCSWKPEGFCQCSTYLCSPITSRRQKDWASSATH